MDIDALVETLADAKAGQEMSDRVFTCMHRLERNITVAFMADMIGSTKGWINLAEREALLMMCEVLGTLDDRYVILWLLRRDPQQLAGHLIGWTDG